MKKFYFVVTETKEGKHFSSVIGISESSNIIQEFKKIPNATHANIFATKKLCEEIANDWNDCYIANGTHMFKSKGE